MKKLMSILMAMMMAAALLGTVAFAEETVQPEGGRKFESHWAIAGGLVTIDFEEEGYRVAIELCNAADNSGEIWEYNCLYSAEQDALTAVSAVKRCYTFDAETFEQIFGEDEYNLFMEEDMDIRFTVSEEGKLLWQDSVENAGADLEFVNIGCFDGQWTTDEEEDLWAEISWNGLDEEEFFYTVFIHRGQVEFLMNGFYNPETGKLECMGTATQWVDNGQGGFDPVEDGENYEAFFSMLENGNLLFETANGIEMHPDDSEG